jgi:hypothetical protein
MRLLLLLLPAIGLASASRCVPATSGSYGFRLIVNVTDLSNELTPYINHQYVNIAHIGAAINRAVATTGQGPIFYQNGTSNNPSLTNVVTDGGAPPFPEGMSYQQEQTDAQGQGIYVSVGPGAQSVKLTRLTNPYSYLTILAEATQSTFLGCNSTIPYYGDQVFQVINWISTIRNATGSSLVIPQGCVPINLVPECAVLPALPPDAMSSHEWAQEVRCYENVGGIQWQR